jgi:hypothetical protein
MGKVMIERRNTHWQFRYDRNDREVVNLIQQIVLLCYGVDETQWSAAGGIWSEDRRRFYLLDNILFMLESNNVEIVYD